MADDVGYTPGVGATIAADDIGLGKLAQRVKPVWGADGTGNDVDTASGKALPIQIRSSTGEDVVKHEDDASANLDPGIVLLATRKAVPANTSGTDGDYESLQVNAGRLWVDASGVTLTIAGAVTNAGTFATQDSQVKAEDAASGDGDKLFPVGVIRRDTPAANANVSADADYTNLMVDNLGQLWTAGTYKEDQASADGDRLVVGGAKRSDTPANTSGTDGDYEPLQVSGGALWTHNLGDFSTVSTSVTHPAFTTAYAANDNWSDSTTAPTAGGFTFTSAARKSGGSGIITDMWVSSSNDPATTLQGEVWITDSAFATNDNDNAAFTFADADGLVGVAVIPFTLASGVGGSATTSYAHVQNLNIGFTCSGSANLRFKVKVKNAYTPASGEVLNIRLKIQQAN